MILISERYEYPLDSGRDLIAIKCRSISKMATNRLLHQSANARRKGRLGHGRQMLAQERHMSKFSIRLTPATYAAALVVVPAVTLAKATTSSSKHIQHEKLGSWLQRSPQSVGQAWPVTRASSQARPAQATPEASTVGCGLLHSMSILTEKFRALMVARP